MALAPGMGGSLIGGAVVVPEYNQQIFDKLDYYNQLQSQQKDRDKQNEIAEQKRKDAYHKYSGGLYDEKKFKTGTNYDDIIILPELAKGKKELAAQINANPGMTIADIQALTAERILPIAQLSEKAKRLNAGLKEMTKTLYSKIPGVNQKAVQDLAFFNATHDIVDGKPVLKSDIESIDDSPEAMTKYISNVERENTDAIMGGDGAGIDWQNTYDANKDATAIGSEFTHNEFGRDLKKSLDAKLFDFQKIDFDKSGRPVLDPNTGLPKVNVPFQMAPAAKDGTPSNLQIATNEDFGNFMSNTARRVWLNGQFKKMNKDREAQGLEPIKYDSMVGDIARKKLVYDALGTVEVPKNIYKYKFDADKEWAMAQRQANTEKNIRLRASLTPKEPKENFGTALLQVHQGNPNYVQGKPQSNSWMGMNMPGTTGAFDISSIVPKGEILSKKTKVVKVPDPEDPENEHKFVETTVHVPLEAAWYNPKTGKVEVQERAGSPTTYMPIKDFLLEYGTVNGITQKQASEIAKQMEEQTEPPKQKTTTKATNKWNKYKR